MKFQMRCCCEDKSTSNNHKSFLSRIRNFTDRLSISFDTKEAPCHKGPIKSNSVMGSSANPGPLVTGQFRSPRVGMTFCKKCHLSKSNLSGDSKEATIVELPSVEKRSMTFPKAKRSQDGRNKSWRTVFAKEKRPSVSLETLPATGSNDSTTESVASSKHKRNFSNPEGNKDTLANSSTETRPETSTSPVEGQKMNFKEIDVRPIRPEILVDQANPGSSGAIDDIGNYCAS